MRSITVPIILAFLLLFAAGARADDLRTISTSGSAVVYVVPDKVVVSIGVDSFDAALDKAKSANEDRAATLVKALKALGVADKDIATDRLNVSARYSDARSRPDPAREVTLEGYDVQRAYTITLKDLKILNKLVDTVLTTGGNRINGIDFQTTELRKYKDQARQMAIRAAKEKAVVLATELDCRVGKPHAITEITGGWYGNSMMQNSSREEASPAPPETSDTLPPGQISVQATVGVTFELQ